MRAFFILYRGKRLLAKYYNKEKSLLSSMILYILLILLILISLFSYKYVYNIRVNQEFYLKLFILIAFFLWILELINNQKILLRKSILNFPIFLFILIMSISLIISNNQIVGIRDYVTIIAYFLTYFLILNNLKSEKQFHYFIITFFSISSIVAIFAIIQYYDFNPYFNLMNKNEITSTIGQKNWISNYISMIFPVIFSYFLLEKIKKNKILYFFLLSILYATLIICQSRGIWISTSITLILAICIIIKFNLLKIFQENKKWLTLLLITFLIITIIYSTDNFLNKSAITVPQRAISTFDEQDPSINTRLLMWKTTFEMIKDRPIFGSGIGTFKMNYLFYQAEFLNNNSYFIKYSGNAKEAHNEYLQIAAELGLLGLGIFLYIIYLFYRIVLNFFKKEENSEEKIIILGLVIGINIFLLHSIFSFPLHVPALGVTFFSLLGLTIQYMGKFNLPFKNFKFILLKKLFYENKKIKILLSIFIILSLIFILDLIAVKPYIAEIYYYKGIIDDSYKNYEKALPNFKYASYLDIYNGRILHALGTTYYNLKIYDKSEEILQRTKKYIVDVNTYNNLGLLYSRLKKYPKAEEEFKQAIYLNPLFDKAYYDLGYIYFIQGKYDSAIKQWNKILEIDPDFSEKYNVLYFMGIAYQKKEMPDKALEYFVQALQLVPEGDPIEKEIEEEINKIYKSKLEK